MPRRPPSPTRAAAALLMLASFVAGCGAPAGLDRDGRVERLPTPAADGSLAARIAAGPGAPLLSWIERGPDGSSLRFAELEGGAWGAPRTAANGNRWFVNWADTPSVSRLADGALLAHWLERTGEAPYAYAVRLALSRDGGSSFTALGSPHRDAAEAEHGFVSVVPAAAGGADLVWLDGRAMATDPETGATALMHARLDAEGAPGAERVLDERVCDCCSTSAVRLADGALVVAYRDRHGDERRDVSVVRVEAGGAVAPATVPEDGWVIAGCPVNGPALAAHGDRVLLAWFTLGADGVPRVLASVSRDGGRVFPEPRLLSDGPGGPGGEDPAGRVAATALPDGSFAVVYLANRADRPRLMLRIVPAAGDLPGRVVDVSATSRSRDSGFPAIASWGDGVIVAFTSPGEPSRVESVFVGLGAQAPAASRRGDAGATARAVSTRSLPARFAR